MVKSIIFICDFCPQEIETLGPENLTFEKTWYDGLTITVCPTCKPINIVKAAIVRDRSISREMNAKFEANLKAKEDVLDAKFIS